jgi:sugar phosphate permease
MAYLVHKINPRFMINNKTAAQDGVYKKIAWRLMPVLFLAYIFAYLDRVNIGFAKLGMKEEAWFNDEVFALASGIFFIGYFLFEVPGNILMHRIGARIWITRIMLTWGIISGLCAISSSANMFYWIRFLLGVAEAGFFPAIILYLTYWFPKKRRAAMFAMFMVAVNFAGIVGSPLSGYIMDSTKEIDHLKPWQWLFLIEAVPSILLGLFIPFLLTNRPDQANWLSEEEKKIVQQDMEADAMKTDEVGRGGFFDAFKSGKVWLFASAYFCIAIGLYGISFWLPQIIENSITKDKVEIGFLAAIPWSAAAIGMVIFGRKADQTGKYRQYVVAACFLSMLGFIGSGLHNTNAVFVLTMISVAAIGLMSAVSTFWSLPTTILSGSAAAAGIAFINSIGGLGGFISPEMFVWFKTNFDLGVGLMAAGGIMGIAGTILLLMPKKR